MKRRDKNPKKIPEPLTPDLPYLPDLPLTPPISLTPPTPLTPPFTSLPPEHQNLKLNESWFRKITLNRNLRNSTDRLCPIDTKDMLDGEECVIMNCESKHMFHYECLKKEYDKKKVESCPLCKNCDNSQKINEEMLPENRI